MENYQVMYGRYRTRRWGLAAFAFFWAALAVAKTVVTPFDVAAAPAVSVIEGAPLQVHVGDDNSFQIFNSDVAGSGQIFPSNATDTADMGWFVRTADTLYAPNFGEHPGGTATGGIGVYEAFTPETLSAVSGSGSATDPFVVTVASALGASGLSATQQVRYVNGDNYFTKVLTLTNESGSTQALKVFLGADIYLANSDSGSPYIEDASTSPGGQTCAGITPVYTILLIPQTPPDAYSANGYGNIWSQIGAAQLDNSILDTDCIDNGSALQWDRTLADGASVTVQTAVSFGDIPPIAQFNVTAITPDSGAAGSTVDVTIRGIGFQPGTTFELGAGIDVSNVAIVDATTATARLTIASTAAPGRRDVGGTQAAGGLTATLPDGFTVVDGAPAPFGLITVTPASGRVGSSVNVTIRGNGFQGDTLFDFGPDIDVSNPVIVDATTATATLTIAPAATPGPRDVTGSQAAGGATAMLDDGFTVIGGMVPPGSPNPVPASGTGGLIILLLMVATLALTQIRRRDIRRATS